MESVCMNRTWRTDRPREHPSMVKLSSLVGRVRSGQEYDLLRPHCVKRRGTVVVPAKRAFQFCVLRCFNKYRRNRLREEEQWLRARMEEYNRTYDAKLMERVTTNRLWRWWIRRARERARLRREALERKRTEWEVEKKAWERAEELRKFTCCGKDRSVTSRTVQECHDCRACNLGVLSSNCECYYYDATVETYTCDVCGDVFVPRCFSEPYPYDEDRWHVRRSGIFDACRRRFPRLVKLRCGPPPPTIHSFSAA